MTPAETESDTDNYVDNTPDTNIINLPETYIISSVANNIQTPHKIILLDGMDTVNALPKDSDNSS